ncbi:RmlC-like cupins superfamily protein [Rhynchospora pubera]|uniref:RmlC-like cupins superfamily protein n=1 Tax=Rhynchospora pubera TaxID=906938 RepID=A0AAV8CZR2_9POAL|nr:RmlC-like cupins superfamily protein [Rhynchospora pubera]KAJ4761788.1 RmlC-like cupins superfamily protein [Rhynchospora pubera]
MASPVLSQRASSASVLFSSSSTSSLYAKSKNRSVRLVRVRAQTMATEKLGVIVEKNPPESRLTELSVRQWPKWGCPPSNFPWTYSSKETCYLLEGKVKVYPEGHNNEYVEIEAGDLVVFPKGMSCTWDVSVGVDKHFKFD